MKNFKINTNHQPLTPDDISKGKDFSKLMSAYKAARPPFYRTAGFKILAASLIACFIGVAVFLATKDNTATINAPFIQPPLAGINIEYTTYEIEATKDSVLFYKTGSAIRIPAHAFLDEAGKKVRGIVNIQYREFHTVQEAFIAGIPMEYDSAGEKLFFETAGMMEISASQNGKQLKPNPAAMIHVNMISYNDAERFNSYYLDTVGRKWMFKEKSIAELVQLDETQKNDLPSAGPAISKKEEAISEAAVPVIPAKADVGKPRFRIEVSEEEFPEIAVYKNIKFQPAADAGYDPKKAGIEWTSGEIKRLPGSNAYEVIFSNATERYSVKATPVFEENDLKDAQKLYNEYTLASNKRAAKQDKAKREALIAKQAREKEEMEAARREASNMVAMEQKRIDEASQIVYAERAERLKKRREAMEAAEAEQERKIAAQMAAYASAKEEYIKNLGQADLVYRTFQVSRFGFYNSDCAGSSLSAVADATLVLPGSETAGIFYLVEKGINRMYSYHPESLSSFRYSSSAQNIVWCVTQSGKLAVIKPEAFATAAKAGRSITLNMQLVEKQFMNVEEVKAYLEI